MWENCNTKQGLLQRGLLKRKELISVKYFHRLVLAIVAHEDMELEQLDVKMTFLYRDLEEMIYM